MRWRSLVVLLLALALAAEAWGHWTEDAALEVVVGGREASASWQVARPLVESIDDDHDGVLSESEVQAHQEELRELIAGKLVLDSSGPPAELTFEADPLPESSPTHARLRLVARWEHPVGHLLVKYRLWPATPIGVPRCMLVVDKGGEDIQSVVLTPDQDEFGDAGPWQDRASSFFFLGAQHIFTGYDHILFLISLMLPGGSLMSIVKTVSAFTLAHSLTLSLSVLGIVNLPSKLVETTIAFSIVVAAFLNLRKDDDKRRWPLAMGFGLIHGLGFASILHERGVSGKSAVLPLVSFNLGVEAGQLCIVLATFPLLIWLHRRRWAHRGVVSLSLVIAALAAVWMVQRLLG